MQPDLAARLEELIEMVLGAAFQGLLTLPFLILWAFRRYEPYQQWKRIRARWHHAFRLGP